MPCKGKIQELQEEEGCHIRVAAYPMWPLPDSPRPSTMRFLVIGDNGRTIKLVINHLLLRGHTLTRLVRTASSLEPRSDLMVVTGTPTKQTNIQKAVLVTSDSLLSAVIVILDHGKGISVMASITRESVAKWLTDAALTCKWDYTCPLISD
jgi:hypothetical protein